MVRSVGNMSLKNPVILPEIDPGTVRLVAQRLNHYATTGPYNTNVQDCIEIFLWESEGGKKSLSRQEIDGA